MIVQKLLKLLDGSLSPHLVIAGGDYGVSGNCIDSDFGCALDVLEQLSQSGIIKYVAGGVFQCFAHCLALYVWGRLAVACHDLALDSIGIDGIEQAICERLRIKAPRLLDDACPLCRIELAVESG
jgi:hypothetical protein